MLLCLQVHPVLAGWSLRAGRSQLVQAVHGALRELGGLQSQLQQWQAALVQLGQQLEEQLSAVMLFAVPALKVGLFF